MPFNAHAHLHLSLDALDVGFDVVKCLERLGLQSHRNIAAACIRLAWTQHETNRRRLRRLVVTRGAAVSGPCERLHTLHLLPASKVLTMW